MNRASSRCARVGALTGMLLGLGCGRLRYVAPDAGVSFADAAADAATTPDAPSCERFVRYDEAGSGTEEDPFRLCSEAQLRSMSDEETPDGAFFRLENNIVLAAAAFKPIGWSRPFVGNFDGNGHVVSGLTVTVGMPGEAGLFAATLDTRIHDLSLRGARVDGSDRSALLVGRSTRTRVERVRVEGRVTGRAYVGGVVGQASDTQFFDVRAAVTLQGTDRFVGGAVGQLQRGNVVRVLVTGSASSMGGAERCLYVGGVVGDLDAGTIQESAADIVLTNSGGITGGIVGWAARSEVLDVWTSGSASGGAGGVAPGGRVDSDRYLCSGPAGWSYVGGVIGASLGSNLERSWSAMSLTGTGGNVGGLVAQNVTSGSRRGSVARSFAATVLLGVSSRGAITETLEADVMDIYFDSSVMGLTRACAGSCRADTGMGRGVDGAAMPTYFQTSTNPPMSLWDFAGVWSEQPGAYPALRSLPTR